MILLLLKLITITSILVLAWTIVTQEGMLLYWIREWANEKHDKGAKWVEPTMICHWCMPSLWTSLGFAFAFGLGIIKTFEWNLILLYILTVGGSSLICGIIWGVHKLIESTTAKNEAQEAYFIHQEKLSYMEIKDRKEEYKKRKQ